MVQSHVPFVHAHAKCLADGVDLQHVEIASGRQAALAQVREQKWRLALRRGSFSNHM